MGEEGKVCENCEGTGMDGNSMSIMCPTCNGTGKLPPEKKEVKPIEVKGSRIKCPKCQSESVAYTHEESQNLKCKQCGEIFFEGTLPHYHPQEVRQAEGGAYKPIENIQYRTAQEVFDIMVDRIKSRDKELIGEIEKIKKENNYYHADSYDREDCTIQECDRVINLIRKREGK